MTVARNLAVLFVAAFALAAASQDQRQQRLWQDLEALGGDRNLPLLTDAYVSADRRTEHMLESQPQTLSSSERHRDRVSSGERVAVRGVRHPSHRGGALPATHPARVLLLQRAVRAVRVHRPRPGPAECDCSRRVHDAQRNCGVTGGQRDININVSECTLCQNKGREDSFAIHCRDCKFVIYINPSSDNNLGGRVPRRQLQVKCIASRLGARAPT